MRDELNHHIKEDLDSMLVFPASHYATSRDKQEQMIPKVLAEMEDQVAKFEAEGKLVEAQRIYQRTTYDMEMVRELGYCNGIENYSRYLTGRNPGEPPPTLFEYLPENALLIVDECHVTVPQLGAMYKGDFSRKSTLSQYGFRLPSCLDNRPLKREEWDAMRPQTIFVSATPAEYELNKTGGVFVEQIIRPTGLIDPPIEVRPTHHQIDNLVDECNSTIERGHRVMITTLTKKMAEDLSEYMHEEGLKVRYLHSDIDTLERVAIIRDLRLGVFNVLVGINLLREGLDIPECALMAILDADKEGYLRSKTSLIQTIGRAARNIESKVIMYADLVTKSMQEAINETQRRRDKQLAFNTSNNITPLSIKKNIEEILKTTTEQDHVTVELENAKELVGKDLAKHIKDLEKKMNEFAAKLEFEDAAKLRDEINRLKAREVGIPKKIIGLKN